MILRVIFMENVSLDFFQMTPDVRIPSKMNTYSKSTRETLQKDLKHVQS